jgi:ubiquinone/menaquinone biosynthesis C-methylase UbiE
MPATDGARLNAALAEFSQLRSPGEDTFLDAKESPLVRAERVRSYLLIRQGLARARRVLDIGCGSGQSTRDAARLARDGSALGVDLSESMLAEARRRASTEGLANVEFLRADAQVHAFDTATFDLAISRFGSMFFSDRTAAFANIASALRPGGRVALLVWQATARNEWIMVVRESMAACTVAERSPAEMPVLAKRRVG